MKLEIVRHDGHAWRSPLPRELDSPGTLVLVFVTPELVDRPVLDDIRASFPRAALIGCSSAGEIHGGSVFDGSVVVGVARFEGTRLRTASAATGPGLQSRAAGAELGRALDGDDLRASIVLCDGLHVNGTELVAGLNETMSHGVVVGGLAGDGDRFLRTWVLDRSGCSSGRVVGVGLYGDRVRIGHGSKGGWDIFGVERRVTRASGNVLYELDGKPALALYKEYLGERAAGLPATALLFPLGMRTGQGDEKFLVRTVLAVDEPSQSLTFAGDIPQGSLVQLMRANIDRLVQGASDAASIARPATADGDVLSLAISCVGRRLVLGSRVDEELEATQGALGSANAQQLGFYSYGEISPHTSGPCDLHNQTMTVTTLAETA